MKSIPIYYKGYWVKGLKSGFGTQVDNKGNTTNGYFKDDILVKEVKVLQPNQIDLIISNKR